jgi:3-hydroxymyristoyl/3-hydroxydecanoyl-(acyl carrier protein) dehydratase
VRAATPALANTTTTFCIAADHPALPGHFPGAPVVPGVLLLAEGLHRLELLTAKALQCQRIDSAKFLQPVAAGATITAILTMTTRGQGSIEFYVAGALAVQVKFSAAATAGHKTHA